jgi:hypothetical protein
MHGVGRDRIVAFAWLCCKRNDKAELGRRMSIPISLADHWPLRSKEATYIHEHNPHGEGDTQIMPAGLLYRKNNPRQQQEDTAYGAHYGHPLCGSAHGIETIGIGDARNRAWHTARSSVGGDLA